MYTNFTNFFDSYDNNINTNCTYVDLSLTNLSFNDYFVHLNVCSLKNKVSELESLITLLNFPKVVLLSETWLSSDIDLINITNNSFISSYRKNRHGGGVGMHVHNDVKYCIKVRSCDLNTISKIDYILLELLTFKIAVCCAYCPPGTKTDNIINLIEHIKGTVDPKSQIVFGGDFNINILDDKIDSSIDFINSVNMLALHPVISLPIRVTNATATLIDNFLCDFSMLPLNTNVITTDISDHYMIALQLPKSYITCSVKKRNFCQQNKEKFTMKLINVN